MSDGPNANPTSEAKEAPVTELKPISPKKLKTHKTVPIKTQAPAKKPTPPPEESTAPTACTKKCTSRFKRFFIVLIILGIISVIGLKMFGEWGAKQLVTEYITIESPELTAAGPLRIAFIADVHNDAAMLELVVTEVQQHQPDIIFFGGDVLNAQGRFMRTRAIIKAFEKLAVIAPTYAILGNHDMEKLDECERVFKKANITLLRNQAIDWSTPSGKQIRLIGLGDWNEYDEDPAACMRPVGEEQYPVILLSHDPESRWLLNNYEWDLMLAGHTHGGQLGNPKTGEFISFRSSMPAGLFDYQGNRKVYVTRGVGATKNMRFFCPAEVSIIDIK